MQLKHVFHQVQTNEINSYRNNPEALLRWIRKSLPVNKIVMGTGFGPPGIVLLDMLLRVTRDISVFYIDTGFLFDQTYELRDKLQKKYGFEFLRFSTEVTPEKQTEMYGEKLWEKDPDICCSIRKVIPLKNALQNYDFWITGILSSFLDNAPTYLVFFNTAGGDSKYLMTDGMMTLTAISAGAVFMGAMTYIGNAPNFMVKSIAEENKINMPSFFGYMGWSLIFLIPIFILLTFIIF